MDIKDNMLKFENGLSKYATRDKDAIRLLQETDEDIRPEYFHDTDRIIHSLSYTRYIDKTQVFSHKQNDHISKRIIHVQLVSKIARTIGRALNLNEDLIEAIALGHDIGHVPYGHLGEKFLSDLSLEYDNSIFMHNVQSVRCLMNLEKNGKGNNLTIQTLDGILCHNGEFVSGKYMPREKSMEDFLSDYNACYSRENYSKKLIPMTLEGCVVRLSDIIGYLGRDIEDAVRLGLFDTNEIPESISSVLGKTNKEIVNTLIMDVINNSLDKNYIEMSKEVYKAISDLKDFNYNYIYRVAMTEEEQKEVQKMFQVLFLQYLKDLKENNKNSSIYEVYLKEMCDEYIESTNDARKVIDYIAGMTDEYFLREYKKSDNKVKTHSK